MVEMMPYTGPAATNGTSKRWPAQPAARWRRIRRHPPCVGAEEWPISVERGAALMLSSRSRDTPYVGGTDADEAQTGQTPAT